MKSSSRAPDETAGTVLLASFAAGLYLAVFYVLNNLTMLQGGGILFLFGVLIVPLSLATLLVHGLLHVAGKAYRSGVLVAFVISAFLLFMLRPSLLGLELVDRFFRAFPAGSGGFANALFIVVPAALLAIVFHRGLRRYAALLGVMTLAAPSVKAARSATRIRMLKLGRKSE